MAVSRLAFARITPVTPPKVKRAINPRAKIIAVDMSTRPP